MGGQRGGRRPRRTAARWVVPAVLGVVLGTACAVLVPGSPAVSLPHLAATGPAAPVRSATAEPSGPAGAVERTEPLEQAAAPEIVAAAKGSGAGSDAADEGAGTDGPRAVATVGADCPEPASRVLSSGRGDGPTVALTFDDGPDAQTGAVLDVLAREEVPATFFVVGRNVDAHPDLVRRAVDEGHLVGNHTWDHRYPRDVRGGWTRGYLDDVLGRTSSAITTVTGEPVCWFRPPGGFLPRAVVPSARGLQMTTQLWSVDSLDWKIQERSGRTGAERERQVDELVANATAAAGQRHPVVLMHDGGGRRDVTVEALPRIIDWYRAHGYTFVRVDGSR